MNMPNNPNMKPLSKKSTANTMGKKEVAGKLVQGR
jgi:hypothetical protein